MDMQSKCPFCKKQKFGVIWRFEGNTGCKECADKFVEDIGLKREIK